ncbi:disease resistance protein RGA2-like [Rhodamnia argentea]|uniref:Disease resistance protein RGA2-like n=1 Tax=Rhodamnia argentea TaxID=178133 RepID=A0ABM3HHU9_9MYRT|nr:disease resistance protein RGA2-like [Rhodamnia argentea]XP_048136181.1 disease resistance protein RGA2-like [Rhodamnia argentea]
MAEAVIGIIAKKIIEILGSQVIETVGKLWGVNHELKALEDAVSMLQPFLDHAEEQYHQTDHVRVWVEKLKDAFYEAQDVLEEFGIAAMRRELRGNNEMMKEKDLSNHQMEVSI